MREYSKPVSEMDLLQLLKAIWHKVWIVILAVCVGAAAAAAWAQFMITPQYESSTLLYVNNSSFSPDVAGYVHSSSEISAAKSLVDTYIVILKTRTTLEEVVEKAELSYPVEKLSRMISASAVNSTEIFKITVTSPDPAEAQKIANTIAEVLPEKISNVVEGSSVRTVDEAKYPTKNSSPHVANYALAGAAIGFVISAFAIIIMELKDDCIHGGEYLTMAYQIPVLAEIPDLNVTGKGYGNDGYNKTYSYGK